MFELQASPIRVLLESGGVVIRTLSLGQSMDSKLSRRFSDEGKLLSTAPRWVGRRFFPWPRRHSSPVPVKEEKNVYDTPFETGINNEVEA